MLVYFSSKVHGQSDAVTRALNPAIEHRIHLLFPPGSLGIACGPDVPRHGAGRSNDNFPRVPQFGGHGIRNSQTQINVIGILADRRKGQNRK